MPNSHERQAGAAKLGRRPVEGATPPSLWEYRSFFAQIPFGVLRPSRLDP